jgi:hypothetical protein
VSAAVDSTAVAAVSAKVTALPTAPERLSLLAWQKRKGDLVADVAVGLLAKALCWRTRIQRGFGCAFRKQNVTFCECASRVSAGWRALGDLHETFEPNRLETQTYDFGQTSERQFLVLGENGEHFVPKSDLHLLPPAMYFLRCGLVICGLRFIFYDFRFLAIIEVTVETCSGNWRSAAFECPSNN